MTPMTIIFIKFLFGIIEDFGRIFVSFMIFRFPLRSVLKFTILASVINSLSDSILLDIIHIPFFLSEMIAFVLVLLMLIFILKLPTWYSVILAFAFNIIGVMSQLILGIPLLSMHVFTMSQANHETFDICLVQTLGCITGFLIGIPLYKRSIGFHFITENIKLNNRMNKTVIGLIVGSTVFFEASLYYMVSNEISGSFLMIWVFTVMVISLLAIVIKNRIDLKEKYNRKLPKDFGL